MNFFEKLKLKKELKDYFISRIAKKQEIHLGTKSFELFSPDTSNMIGSIKLAFYYSENNGLLKIVADPFIQENEIIESIQLQLFRIDENNNANLVLDDKKSYTLKEFTNQILNSSDIRKYVIRNGSIKQSIPFSDYKNRLKENACYVFEAPCSSLISFYSDEEILELVETGEYMKIFGLEEPKFRLFDSLRNAKKSMFEFNCRDSISKLVRNGHSPYDLNFFLNVCVDTTWVNSSSSTIDKANSFTYMFENYSFNLK